MVKRVSVEIATGRGVAERWRTQYQHQTAKTWTNTVTGDSGKVYDKLCELGPNPDIAKVAEIIGNKSWSYLYCSGCGDQVERAVSFGSDYSDTPILLCAACISDGAKAIQP